MYSFKMLFLDLALFLTAHVVCFHAPGGLCISGIQCTHAQPAPLVIFDKLTDKSVCYFKATDKYPDRIINEGAINDNQKGFAKTDDGKLIVTGSMKQEGVVTCLDTKAPFESAKDYYVLCLAPNGEFKLCGNITPYSKLEELDISSYCNSAKTAMDPHSSYYRGDPAKSYTPRWSSDWMWMILIPVVGLLTM